MYAEPQLSVMSAPGLVVLGSFAARRMYVSNLATAHFMETKRNVLRRKNWTGVRVGSARKRFRCFVEIVSKWLEKRFKVKAAANWYGVAETAAGQVPVSAEQPQCPRRQSGDAVGHDAPKPEDTAVDDAHQPSHRAVGRRQHAIVGKQAKMLPKQCEGDGGCFLGPGNSDVTTAMARHHQMQERRKEATERN